MISDLQAEYRVHELANRQPQDSQRSRRQWESQWAGSTLLDNPSFVHKPMANFESKTGTGFRPARGGEAGDPRIASPSWTGRERAS